MERIEFCIAENLGYYLGCEQDLEAISFLYLAMDVLGFQYNGIRSNCYELLNGLNAKCDTILKRCFDIFGFETETFKRDDIINIGIEDLIIGVDDYYIKYSLYFQKYHHLRYIYLIKFSREECLVYDMGVNSIKEIAGTLDKMIVEGFRIKNKNSFAYNTNIANRICSNMRSNKFGDDIITASQIHKNQNHLPHG